MPLAIVLPLPAEVAARVAMPSSVPGALPASDLHVTLCVLTSAPPDLVGTLASLAARSAPIAAQLSGVGRFAGAAGELDAFHLTVDAPALGELRNCIEAEHYRFIDRTHGLDPHLTLAYLARDAPSPFARADAMPVRFEALAAWDGDARTTFPLGTAMDHLVTLDAVELPLDPPTELRLFGDGWNETTKGRFLLDVSGAAEILRRFTAHGVDLAMDFDHATFGEASAADGPGGGTAWFAYWAVPSPPAGRWAAGRRGVSGSAPRSPDAVVGEFVAALDDGAGRWVELATEDPRVISRLRAVGGHAPRLAMVPGERANGLCVCGAATGREPAPAGSGTLPGRVSITLGR